MSLTVLDPTADVADPHLGPLVEPPESLRGIRFGVLDNGKSNSDQYLAALSARLVELGAVAGRTVRKRGVGSLAPTAQLEEVRSASDLVITGVGDCAGCCSCSVQDAIELERRGTPAVLICTSELVTTGRIAAAAAGVPDYPFVVVQHPVASCTPDELADRVQVALDQILERIPA